MGQGTDLVVILRSPTPTHLVSDSPHYMSLRLCATLPMWGPRANLRRCTRETERDTMQQKSGRLLLLLMTRMDVLQVLGIYCMPRRLCLFQDLR